MIEHTEFLIGGRMTAPSTDDVINVISPHSEQPIGRTPAGAPRDIDAAVAAARAAMEGEWGATSAAERADVMGRLLVECSSRAEELGFAQVSEMGCPVSQVQPVMVQPSFGVLDYYRSLATETVFEERRVGIGGTSGFLSLAVFDRINANLDQLAILVAGLTGISERKVERRA